jgi:predicted peptidase
LIDQQYVEAYTDTKIQEQYPAFVVAPQIPCCQRWVNVPPTVSSYALAAQPSASLTLADEIVQSLEQTYPMIDPNRVYVMGLSMGGFGAWEVAERWPGTFAATIPVSGAGDPHAADAMAHVPVWALHGTLDDVVPVAGSRLMVQAIKAAGGSPCYTEFPQGAHNIWTEQNLDNPQLLSWLFSQTKKPGSGIMPQSCPASAQA